MACKEGQFDAVKLMANDQFKTFSINLNAQHVNGMTPFDLAVHSYGYQDSNSQVKSFEKKSRGQFISFPKGVFFLRSAWKMA